MSYLRAPRLIFSGNFQADPSTVNNDPEHFDSANFDPNYQQAGEENGWWNPNGTAAWRLKNCFVTRVIYSDGTTCDDPNVDPIVGTPVLDDAANREAKIVDLDSEQQLTSQIWGLKVFIVPSAGGIGFSGDFAVASFLDLFQRSLTGGGVAALGAAFQSVLQPVQWLGAGMSRYLQELSVDGIPIALSIKFNVDGYNDDSTSPDFTSGRVVGAIGPQLAGEPLFFVAGRILEPVGSTTLNSAYAEVVDNTLTIDLGNSLNTASPNGSPGDAGVLTLVIQQAGSPAVPLGAIPHTDPDWYSTTAGIVSFVLSQAQLQIASSSRLAILSSNSPTPLLVEPVNGMWIRADTTVFRLTPGETATTRFFATVFGKRSPGTKISLGYDPSTMEGQTTQGPIPGPQIVGSPQSAFTFPGSVTTAHDGTATLTVAASDPGNPRQYIDGQVYGVNYGLGNVPPPAGSTNNPSRIISALIWSNYIANPNPTWTTDVKPILTQYANLYPVMKQYVDLSDYNSVVANAILIQQVLSLPMTDPLYMPVTRDLSPAKNAMILNWLNNPVP